jgi:hypothetical protein
MSASVFGLSARGRSAPRWTTSEWFNLPGGALQPADLRGKVVVLHAFQMLCPACVAHGLPQAMRVHAHFAAQGVVVVGLHTVFEHHAAMRPVSLEVFLHEYRIAFPVGVDAPSAERSDPVPVTMRTYGLQGTPSLILIDRHGDLRLHAFGAVDDMALGAAIAALVGERS